MEVSDKFVNRSLLDHDSITKMSIREAVHQNNEATTTILQENSLRIEEVHPNHPLYIHASDTHGSILISVRLQGTENYSLWSKSLMIVLRGKHKLGFVLGTCKREMFKSNLH